MSSRKSDNLPPLHNPGASPWLVTLRANALLPVFLVLLWPLGALVEHSPCLGDYPARIVMLIGINVILAVSLQLINGVAGQFSLGHAGFMAVGAYMAGYPTATYARNFPSDPTSANPAAILLFHIALLMMLALAAGILAGLFVLIRQCRRLHGSLPGLLMVLVFVWFIADVKLAYSAPPPAWYLVWSQIIMMLKGLFTFLVGAGQHAAGSLNGFLPAGLRTPLTFLLALLGGGVLAAVAGLIVGLPTLRLRGDYLAIATLGFAEIIRVAVINSEALGKATGLSVPAYSIVPDPEAGIPARRIFPWIYAAVLITIVAVWRLANSAKGRALQAVREDEIAAAATGIDTTHHKVLSFVFGAFFAGVAGGLYAHYDGYLNPNSFGIMRSIELVVIVTLGGLGSISGAILAAVVLTILPEALRFVDEAGRWKVIIESIMRACWGQRPPTGNWLCQVLQWLRDISWSRSRMVLYSLLLIVMMLLRPRGLLGGRELWWRRRAPLHAPTPLLSSEAP